MKKSVIIIVSLLFVFSAVGAFADGMTSADLLAEARAQIMQAPADVAKLLFDEGDYVFIDVREPTETKMGFVPGAILIPRGLLEFKIAGEVADPNTQIVVYCASGGRSSLAAYTLKQMGYTNVISMAGGWRAWSAAGFPIAE
jgi:rhodanese-related sulfurtransferase